MPLATGLEEEHVAVSAELEAEIIGAQKEAERFGTLPADKCLVRRRFLRMCTRTCPITCVGNVSNWGYNQMNDNNKIQMENAVSTSTMTMIQALRSAMDVMLEARR